MVPPRYELRLVILRLLVFERLDFVRLRFLFLLRIFFCYIPLYNKKKYLKIDNLFNKRKKQNNKTTKKSWKWPNKYYSL